MNEPHKPVGVIFDAAIELPPEQRAAYLQEACAGDDPLRRRVEALLGAHDSAESFMNSPAVRTRGETAAVKSAERPGDRIGRYKLLQQIGEGGCGVVYMAEQEEPVHRRVALKVIKLGMDTKSVIARFEAERQALALMDHPNIAKVLDAGATDTGRPYFVMELVRGVKITDFCDENNLSTEDRLKLFIQVCQAIQHAHQKGVIHRDIKPSNILVTVNEPGGPGCPKVIDFGIAKATTGQRLTDKTVFTAFEQFIGTPAYMSPEQAMMTSLDIDTRTDIYALGVLLYELLTGKTPLDQKELLAAGVDEMRRAIREKEPPRPSTRLSTMLEGELTTAAKHRHTDAPKLIHLLRGDLDWIVMKALEKDRARRYETANGLANDIQRHLDNEPVVARPPSNLYRLRKMARRNRLAFAAAVAVAAALVLGLAASTREYLRAVAAEKQARAINRFLTEEVLGQATPEKNAREKNTTIIEALSAATTNLDEKSEYRQQPKLEASLRLAVGRTYYTLGRLSEAERNLRQAVKLGRRALGPQHLDTLAAQHWLAKVLTDQRNWEEAEGLIRETWEGRQRLRGAEDRDTLDSQELYAETLREGGQLQRAETISRHNFQIRERVQGPDDPHTIWSLVDLAMVFELLGDFAEAEGDIREALARIQRIGAADKRDGLFTVKELAVIRLLKGDPVEAEKLLNELIPRARRVLGPDNHETLHFQRARLRALGELGRLDEAESVGKETLEALLRAKEDQEVAGRGLTRLWLGRVLVEKGKLDEAEALLQEALRLLRQPALSALRPELPAQAENWLGVVQIERKAYPQAEALMLPGVERFFVPNASLSPGERRQAVGNMVKLYEAWGEKPQQTAVWRKNLDQITKTWPGHRP
jgi:serine/threonine protein kinase